MPNSLAKCVRTLFLIVIIYGQKRNEKYRIRCDSIEIRFYDWLDVEKRKSFQTAVKSNGVENKIENNTHRSTRSNRDL